VSKAHVIPFDPDADSDPDTDLLRQASVRHPPILTIGSPWQQ
jgi:hypothetical protein